VDSAYACAPRTIGRKRASSSSSDTSTAADAAAASAHAWEREAAVGSGGGRGDAKERGGGRGGAKEKRGGGGGGVGRKLGAGEKDPLRQSVRGEKEEKEEEEEVEEEEEEEEEAEDFELKARSWSRTCGKGTALKSQKAQYQGVVFCLSGPKGVCRQCLCRRSGWRCVDQLNDTILHYTTTELNYTKRSKCRRSGWRHKF
jgi:hypothetical protein